MALSSSALQSITEHVCRRFPEVKGSRPKISPHEKSGEEQYLVVFSSKASTADGHAINRKVRVVADQHGKILKMTTSK